MSDMTHDEVQRLLAALQSDRAEIKAHFDIAGERMAERFDRLAESISAVEERLARRAAALEQRIVSSATKTQLMLMPSGGLRRLNKSSL